MLLKAAIFPLLAILFSLLETVLGKRHGPTRPYYSSSLVVRTRISLSLSTIKARTTDDSSGIVTFPSSSTSASTFPTPSNATTLPANGTGSATVDWSKTGIVIPLYSWPESEVTWQPLTDAMRDHPNMPFYVIINPQSGPGDKNTQPGASFQKYIPKLLAYKNAKVIGYISTQYGGRDESDVQTDIETYSNWSPEYAVHGIFFDEVQDGLLSKYRGYVEGVKAGMGEDAFIMLNPGSPAEADYFSIANQIVTFEHNYQKFTQTTLPTSNLGQQSILIYDFMKGDSASLKSVVDGLKQKEVASLYITNLRLSETDVWKAFGTLFSDLVGDVAA